MAVFLTHVFLGVVILPWVPEPRTTKPSLITAEQVSMHLNKNLICKSD